MEDDGKAVDDFFQPTSETQAGNTSLNMLYGNCNTSGVAGAAQQVIQRA